MTPEASTGQWVILVTLEAESSEVTMTGTIFLGGTARRKSSGARSQVCRSVSGPTRRPSCAQLGVAWRKEINRCNKPRRKEISRCNKPRLRGLGPGLPGAWGPGLGAGDSTAAWGPVLERLGLSQKSSGARSQVCRNVSGPTRRPSCAQLGVGVAGERKSIGATSRGERKSVGATSQGYGAWGPGCQGLGAQGLGLGTPQQLGARPPERLGLSQKSSGARSQVCRNVSGAQLGVGVAWRKEINRCN